MKKMHVNFLAWCLLELSFVAVIVISLLTTLNQSALNPRGSPTCGWGWWPHLASIEAIWGVSQVPGWRPLPPKDLALQVVVAACRAADIWRSGSVVSGCPGCWQVLLPGGQVVPTVSQQLWLPGGPIFLTLCS